MTRTQIRYAIFRCKSGTPTKEHEEIFATYSDQLAEFGFTLDDFTTEWDVHKKDLDQIVYGKVAKAYNKNIPIVT
jgi:hypothetical protein